MTLSTTRDAISSTHHTTLESICDRMFHPTSVSSPRNRSTSGRGTTRALLPSAGSRKQLISSSRAVWTAESKFGRFTKIAAASVRTLATDRPCVTSTLTILARNSSQLLTIVTSNCGTWRPVKWYLVSPTKRFPTASSSIQMRISSTCLSPEWLIKRLFV